MFVRFLGGGNSGKGQIFGLGLGYRTEQRAKRKNDKIRQTEGNVLWKDNGQKGHFFKRNQKLFFGKMM